MSKPRLVLFVQNTGKVGKTFVLAKVMGWAMFRGVPVMGLDLDPDHRTLSLQFSAAQAVDLSDQPEGDILRAAAMAQPSSLTILDLRAHLRDAALAALEDGGLLALADVVVLITPLDTVESLEDLATTYDRLKGRVQWLVVRNLGRAGNLGMWDRSPLRADYLADGARELTLPVLLRDALQAIAGAEIRTGRALSLHAIVSEPGLISAVYESVVAGYLRRVYLALDGHAEIFAPWQDIVPPPKPTQTKSEPRRRGDRLKGGQ